MDVFAFREELVTEYERFSRRFASKVRWDGPGAQRHLNGTIHR